MASFRAPYGEDKERKDVELKRGARAHVWSEQDQQWLPCYATIVGVGQHAKRRWVAKVVGCSHVLDDNAPTRRVEYGLLAEQYCDVHLPLQVLRSGAGYYIGTFDGEGPCSRESIGYWPTYEQADKALRDREWVQKPNP